MSYRNDYKAVAEWVVQNRTNDARLEIITINALRNILFDLAPIMSGYCSVAAIDECEGRLTKMVVEHYHSRQTMARKIIALAKTTDNLDELEDMVKEACKAHRTTKAENLALIPYQKKPDYNWEEAYEDVGIELIAYDGPTMEIVFEDILYVVKSKAELARRLNVSSYQINKYAKVL